MATHGAGSGRRALVIGGAGKMGGWFVQFLLSQGFDVQVADPAGGSRRMSRSSPTGARPRTWMLFDYIVVATPLGASGAILGSCAATASAAVVFDLGSLKSPLRAGLARSVTLA